VGGITLKEMIGKIWPFVVACLIVLILVTYIPGISMLLPNLMAK
jgi:TRAP-type C4-dicarboxylate transport system permease large subunit